MVDPAVVSDPKEYARIAKEHANQAPLVAKAREYLSALDDIEVAKEMLRETVDADEKEMLQDDISTNEAKLPGLEDEIKIMLIPGDPNDDKDTIVEIRAGVGGDEAGIFAGDLFKMYERFAGEKKWKIELLDVMPSEAGGYSEISFKVKGDKVYSFMKFESGVHRVQRVPQTETQGRVHTSAASVAVLPEAEEFDVEISMNDIRKDIFCASGPGGQSVNTTYSAIRLTHIPTGIVVQCQDQKSQLKNFDKAFEELRTRVFNLEYSKYLDEIASKRKTMVSTGDRSAKIRTYNYPQGRITDHRINYTIYNLSAFMDGDIQDCIDHLIVAENAERLKESEL
jgi:peptide chain release factor 1